MTIEQLRRFVLLAEELNFTRAARRLHIAQQVLSNQVRHLERDVGARLFERTTHRVALTAAGEELLSAARTALVALDEGADRARRIAARDEDRLRVGFLAQGASELQAPVMRELRERHPHAAIEMRSFPFTDLLAGLLTGETDAALLRAPPSHPAIRLEVIVEEPRIVLVPSDHPLAGRPSLVPEDLRDLPSIAVRGHDTDPLIRSWTDVHALTAEIGPRPIGAVVETAEEWLQAVVDGAGFTSVPASVTRFYPRPGLTGIPLHDVTPLPLSVGWRRELDDSALVRDLLALARAEATRSH